MKVLFIAGGRRVSLAKKFIKEGFEIFSYETEEKCPISVIATVIKGKSWNDHNIKEDICNVINNYNIDIIIPLADTATSILSELIENKNIPRSKIPTSKLKTNNICLNKSVFESAFLNEDFYPKIIKNEPVIVKPIFGANSKGIFRLSYEDYKENIQNYSETHIHQRCVNSKLEISVDAYFNKNSKMVDAIPRERLEIQGGEVNRSRTLKRNDCYNTIELTRKIGENISLVGPVCAQYIIENDKAFIMEINARFGGGVILSIQAGFDIVKLIKQEYINNIIAEPKNYDWKENFYMTRYFEEYFYE